MYFVLMYSVLMHVATTHITFAKVCSVAWGERQSLVLRCRAVPVMAEYTVSHLCCRMSFRELNTEISLQMSHLLMSSSS